MKVKLFHMLVVLTTLVSLFTVINTPAPAIAATIEATNKYVALQPLVAGGDPGNDLSGDGSMMHPWRTITYAISKLPYGPGPDCINVGPSDSLWYGGSVPENIVINKIASGGLIIKSINGAARTTINVDGEDLPQVVLVTTSNNTPGSFIPGVTFITLDGFTLKGAPCGVAVMPNFPNGPENSYMERVSILNCIIEVEKCGNALGIIMFNVKWPVIDNNTIDIESVTGEAKGIVLHNCYYAGYPGGVSGFPATVTNNTINIQGKCSASGIEMWACPLATVQNNKVTLTAGDDVRAVGIRADNSPLISIKGNTVKSDAFGNTCAIDIGIKVTNSAKASLTGNVVTVNANLIADGFGFIYARGIILSGSSWAQITTNTVQVNAVGNANRTVVAASGLLEADELEDIADLSDIMVRSLGVDNAAYGIGTAIGIRVKDSQEVLVGTNTVSPVNVKLTVMAADGSIAGAAYSSACGVAVGIEACDAPAFKALTNQVSAASDVSSWAVQVTDGTASGCADSKALGIAVEDSEATQISGNGVSADAKLAATVRSVPARGLSVGSALSRLNSEIMGAIKEAISDTSTSESVNFKLSGDIAAIDSYADSGAFAAGIGIELEDCDGSSITNNNPVKGIASLASTVWSQASAPDNTASATGGGLGLGIGIAVQDSRSMTVTGNLGIMGNGSAILNIGAQHTSGPPGPATYAGGSGAGIGIGIILCGADQYRVEGDSLTDGQSWAYKPTVANNTVTAMGTTDDVVDSRDLVKSHEAVAEGEGLGLSLGIATLWYPCVVIQGNTVNVGGDAEVDIYSEAVHEVDPLSCGGAAGIGIGILTVECCHAQIIGNTAVGTGTAYAEVASLEKAIILSSHSFGGALGFGAGIEVCRSMGALVTGNSVANGIGDAETWVKATTQIPLGYASAYDVAVGFGNGIGVVSSPFAQVLNCNTAAGNGSASVGSIAQGSFNCSGSLGAEISVDILVVLVHDNYGSFTTTDFEDQRVGYTGLVSYNSMADVPGMTPGASDASWMFSLDAGLLKLGPCGLDARFNWWGSSAGPGGFGPNPAGEEVLWCGRPVKYEPWLWVVHTKALQDQLGYFGFTVPIVKGLNTLSTPIALQENMSRKWSDIVANSGLAGKIKYAFRFNSANQSAPWESIGPDDTLDPLSAWYVYFYDDAPPVIILMANVSLAHPNAMPTVEVNAGWNLIAPNPLFNNCGMPADQVLASIQLTSEGLPGYTQVISPQVKGQRAWIYVPGSNDAPMMESGRGYWIWMKNNDTLAGFGFTPLTDMLLKNMYH